MVRLIDADALKEVFKEKGSEAVCGVELCKAIISQIDNQPTVEAMPVRHGSWIGISYGGYSDGFPFFDEWRCSECGVVFEDTKPHYNYCPSCGAKMDAERKEE